MKKLVAAFLCVLICFASCKNNITPEQTEKILSIKTMGSVATSEYLVSKIVKAADDKTWFKFGNRKILLSCQASIKAGVDVSGISKEDIEANGSEITLYLPPPKILSISIPPETVKLEMEDIGPFRQHFSNEEQNQLLTQAEQQIRHTADSLGIVQASGENAKLFFTSFLKNMGFKKVTVEFSKPQPKQKLG